MDDADEDSLFLQLSNAINMVHALNLYSAVGVHSLQVDDENRNFVQALVWILCSIEGILSLRYGRPSVSTIIDLYHSGTTKFAIDLQPRDY